MRNDQDTCLNANRVRWSATKNVLVRKEKRHEFNKFYDFDGSKIIKKLSTQKKVNKDKLEK